MKAKYLVLTFALAAFCAMPGWAKHTTGGGSSGGGHNGGGSSCTDIPAVLTVLPQSGPGGITGDAGPSNSATYTDGDANGVYAEFQVCNNTNDFVLNLRNTTTSRYLNLDFSDLIGGPGSGSVPVPSSLQQPGLNINEMFNSSLYTSSGDFYTCSGMQLNPWISTISGANAWFKPKTIYDPVVPNCNGGTGPDAANSPYDTSEVHVHFDSTSCTWTVTPVADGSNDYRLGVAETVGKGHKASWVSAGQYQMPFSFQITEQGACTFKLP